MKRTKSKLTRTVAVTVLCAAAVSTAMSQTKESVDLNALAARGEIVANQDPLAVELRNQQTGGLARRGFDIGMGAAEGQTAPGPGKQRIHDSLFPEEQPGYRLAVEFSLERNRNAELARKGAEIAEADSAVAESRNSYRQRRRRLGEDVFYKLGFDIATAIFGDPALGAKGNTAPGPGSLGIRNSLSAAGQNGFDDSVAFNISRRGVTTSNNALAVRGEALANEDPLALELRLMHADGPARRGFDIGMAAAEGQALPGPGKQRIHDSLFPAEQPGYRLAVEFSLERNRNAELARKGAEIAEADSAVAEARNRTDIDGLRRPDFVFYKLGFDIATAIFGDPALGAKGNTATGPGSLGIRDSLSAAGQRGFNDSMSLNLSRRGIGTNTGPTLPANSNVINKGPRIGNTTPEPEFAEIRCRGYNFIGGGAFVFFTIGTKGSLTGETIVTLEMAFTPSLKAAGPDGRGLSIGECAFADRALTDKEPYRVRFETVADGQIRQRQHGTTIDNSPTAAERFPDAQNIPQYLKDANHYWSFFVRNTGSGYFESSHSRFWQPSRTLSPDAIRTIPSIQP
jgi:hypothetical protein